MKYLHLVILSLMLIFAVLQWNDIDGPIWMLVYIATAFLALLAYKQSCIPCTMAWALIVTLSAIHMLVGVSPGVITFLETNAYTEIFFPMNEKKPYIEQTREALGLLIILFYCVIALLQSYKKGRGASSK